MKKRITVIFFAILISTFLSNISLALTLKVGTYDDEPLSFQRNGKVMGIYIDLLNYIAKKEGWHVIYEYGNLNDLLQKLKDGKIDLLTSVAYSPKRAKYAYFSKETVYVNWANICQRSDENLEGIFSFKEKKIGVMDGDIYYVGPNNVHELFEKFEVPVKFVVFPDYRSILKAVQDKKIDAGVVTRLFVNIYARKYKVKETPIIFDPVKLVFAASKENANLLDVLNEIDSQLKEMKKNPTSRYYQILNEYTNYGEYQGIPKWVFEILIYGGITVGTVILILLYMNYILRKKIKKATQDVIKRNKDLERFNRELRKTRDELKKSVEVENTIRRKYSEMLNLFSLQTDQLESKEDVFMQKILSTAILVLEGDYGSVNKIENGKWKFVSTIGHDKNILNAYPLDAKYIFRAPDVKILNMKEYNERNLPSNVNSILKKGAKPIKQTIFIPLIIENMWDGNMCIDLDEKNEKTFSKESLEVARAFKEVTKVFLTLKFNNDIFKRAYIEFARRLANIAESYDQTTGAHITRVGEISAFLALKMGMSADFVEELREFAPLHDIGKILIAKEILKKPGKLSPAEWEEMKRHTLYAKKILNTKYFEMALKIALYHHENYDGSGYPYGLKGEQIPIEAQIVHVVDVYDALRSSRPYKKAFSHEETMKIMTLGDGRVSPHYFNPQILEKFVENAEEINEIFERINKETKDDKI